MKGITVKKIYPMLFLIILMTLTVFFLPMKAYGAPSGETEEGIPAFSDAKETVDDLLYGYELPLPGDQLTERSGNAVVKNNDREFSTQDADTKKIPEEITIYALDEALAGDLSIPESMPTSFDLSGHRWEIVSGDGVTVSDKGIVTIRKEKQYYHRNPDGWMIITSNPSGAEDEKMIEDYRFGDTVLLLDGKQRVTVHGVSYAQYYAEKTMDDYLNTHVKAGMSDYEVAELCCKFLAALDYRADASGYTSMIAKGGGDCWASTDALIYMLEKQGILCSSRDGSADYGAGSRHVNVIAKLDGKYYILEAGVEAKAPRKYYMDPMETSSIYNYSVINKSEKTVEITGLILENEVKECYIPESIDGYTVKGIGAGAFANKDIERVIIPDTVTYLGNQAFYKNEKLKSVVLSQRLQKIGKNCFTWDKSLESVKIPKSVTEIGGNPFLYCAGLESINVESANPEYSSIDGVLFNKEQTSLIAFPLGKTGNVRGEVIDHNDYMKSLKMDYKIPEGVTSLEAYAFASADMNSIQFPSSVTQIKEYCFYNVYINEISWPKQMDTLGSYSLAGATIKSLVLPESLRVIEPYAVYRGMVTSISMKEGVKSIGDYAFAGFGKTVMDLRLPASLEAVGTHALDLNFGWSSFDSSSSSSASTHNVNAVFFAKECNPKQIGEDAFKNLLFCVYDKSPMMNYAKDNQYRYCTLNASGRLELQPSWLLGVKSYYREHSHYTGKEKEPWLDWKTSDGTCPFDIPSGAYTMTYSDNINIGTHKITIKGTGLFAGTLETNFTISPAGWKEDIVDRSGCGLQYSINNGEASIVRYITKDIVENLVIPSKLDGYPVTSIAYGALEGCETLKSVEIPSTVKKIEREAFADCPNLRQVIVPGTVTNVGYLSFGFETATDEALKAGKRDYSGFVRQDGFCLYVYHKSDAERYAKTYGLKWKSVEHEDESYMKVLPAKAATYGSTGLTEGKACSVCGQIFDDQTVIPKKKVPAADGLTLKKQSGKKLKITWKKISKVTGYEVKVSRQSSFKKSDTYKMKSAGKTTKVLSKCKKKTTYYVRVRSYVSEKGKNYYSKWSTTKKLKY